MDSVWPGRAEQHSVRAQRPHGLVECWPTWTINKRRKNHGLTIFIFRKARSQVWGMGFAMWISSWTLPCTRPVGTSFWQAMVTFYVCVNIPGAHRAISVRLRFPVHSMCAEPGVLFLVSSQALIHLQIKYLCVVGTESVSLATFLEYHWRLSWVRKLLSTWLMISSLPQIAPVRSMSRSFCIFIFKQAVYHWN